MTMPSIVRSERSLFARRAPSATEMISPSSITRSFCLTRATTAPATRTAATGPAAALVHSGNATHALPEPIVLLLTLRLKRERGEKRDLFALAQSVDDFSVVEIAGAEH